MRDRIEHAERQAAEARKKTGECTDPHAREQWVSVARMWEELAKECREIENARDLAPDSEARPSRKAVSD